MRQRRIAQLLGRLLAASAACLLALDVLIGTAPDAVSAPNASTPAGWASRCSSQVLGLGQDTVQLAPVLSSDKSPTGGPIISRPTSDGTWVPVIMVHGWTSQDTNTYARTGAFSHIIDLSDNPGFVPNINRSLIGQLQGVPGAAVFTFDYHPYSARWVDDPHLGPALGKVIDCLYQASGQKVIIVAHSMGGLIARYAATQPGISGTSRAGEISTVVTFGTPETGSVAALLAETGVDLGAATGEELAVIRLVLAACGRLASGAIQTGTLCDEIPVPIRAFESASGVALRAGSPQLAALRPWPSSIQVDALAGNVTFELPGPGWFSLPWSTKSVDVGDMIVTQGSALTEATHTMNATCDYQLNPVREATDQLGLLFGWVGRSQVAQQPLQAFTGACFHTDLMRGMELTAEALGAVAGDINSRAPSAGAPAATPTALPASSWVPVGGTTKSAPGAAGTFSASYAGTYWGGLYARAPAGCNYRFEGMARLQPGGSGYGFGVRAKITAGGVPHSEGIQYDPGAGGYRDTLLPDYSETGTVMPLSLDNNWHTIAVEVLGNRYRSSVDGTLIFSGTTPLTCGGVFIRIWRSTVFLRDLSVTPITKFS